MFWSRFSVLQSSRISVCGFYLSRPRAEGEQGTRSRREAQGQAGLRIPYSQDSGSPLPGSTCTLGEKEQRNFEDKALLGKCPFSVA